MSEIWKPHHVRQAEQIVNRLKSKLRPTSFDEENLHDAQLVTRRWLLQRIGIVGGVTIAAGSAIAVSGVGKNVVDLLAGVSEKESVSRGLGRRIKEWKLPDGQLMTNIFPEIADIAEYLTANSLDVFFPVFNGPIKTEYVKQNQPVELKMFTKFFSVENSPVKISSWGPNSKPFNTPILESFSFKVLINEKMKGTGAELVVAAKEVMQIVDLIKYCKRFKRLLEANGTSFDIAYSDDTQYQRDLMILSFGASQINIAESENKYNWLKEFIDTGSLLRVGGIAYANWWLSYPKERALFPPIFTEPGNKTVQFLSDEGLLVEKGNVMLWKNGKAPQVDSDEFAELYSKYTGVPLR